MCLGSVHKYSKRQNAFRFGVYCANENNRLTKNGADYILFSVVKAKELTRAGWALFFDDCLRRGLFRVRRNKDCGSRKDGK